MMIYGYLTYLHTGRVITIYIFKGEEDSKTDDFVAFSFSRNFS